MDRRYILGVFVLVALAMVQFVPLAVDDADASLYRIIARHVVERGELLPLRGVEGAFPEFYEHPPLFFWTLAGVAATVGEGALNGFCALIGLAILALTFVLGRALVGPRAALLGVLLLGLTETFVRYQARVRLDGALTLAFTGAVALIVLARGRWAWWLAAGAVTALGVLIKGPPALGAPVAACLLLVIAGRAGEVRIAPLLLAGVVAIAPAIILLWLDHAHNGGAWWTGYIEGQFLASVSGARTDGHTERTYLLGRLFSRFWPGLPFAIGALIAGRRARVRWGLLAWAALIIAGFSLASRAYWNHIIPAFVPLALLAGAGADDLLARFDRRERVMRWLPAATGVLSAAIVVGMFAGVPEKISPASWFGPLIERIAELPGEAPIALVPARDGRGSILNLTAHTHRQVEVLDASAASALAPGRVAVVARALWPIEGLVERARYRDWVLATK